MTVDVDDHVIAERAVRWRAARLHAETLRAERAKHECAVEKAWWAADNPVPSQKPDPCWKFRDLTAVMYDGNGNCEDDGHMDPSEYCGPCQEREKLRPAFKAANAKRGAAERSFWAAVKTREETT